MVAFRLSMRFIVALYLVLCGYLAAQEGVEPQSYADNLESVSGEPRVFLRAAEFTARCVRLVGQEPVPSKCVLSSTSKAVRKEMKDWVLSQNRIWPKPQVAQKISIWPHPFGPKCFDRIWPEFVFWHVWSNVFLHLVGYVLLFCGCCVWYLGVFNIFWACSTFFGRVQLFFAPLLPPDRPLQGAPSSPDRPPTDPLPPGVFEIRDP